MQCVTTLKDRSTVPANQGLLAVDANVKVSMICLLKCVVEVFETVIFKLPRTLLVYFFVQSDECATA